MCFPQLGVRPMGMPGDGQVPVAPGGETLAPDMLAHASPEQRRNIIGERLYALISGPQPALAGKITGMLLEGMDKSKLLRLIESPESLNLRIREAIEALETRQIIGERLYALISGPQPVLAGKITGMLLEGMDKSKLLHLIESPESLNLRIREAIEALETYQKRQGAE
jgi:hypothetical protein